MAYNELFLLGPLGYMQSLPSPSGRVEIPVVRLGGIKQPISGNASVHTFGFKRSWAFRYPRLPTTDVSNLRAFWRWVQPRALRFVDPFHTNLLTSDASTGGSESRSTKAFTAENGTIVRVDVTSPYPSYIDSAQQWTIPVSTVGSLLLDASYPVPIRDTRSLTFSLSATGAGTVQAFVRPYNVAGVPQTEVLGSTVALDGTWKMASVVYVPSAGHVSYATGLKKQSAGSIQVLSLTAGLLRETSKPSTWVIGEGIGEVYVEEFKPGYRTLGYYSLDFTVREK